MGSVAFREPGVERAGARGNAALRALRTDGDLRSGARPDGGVRGTGRVRRPQGCMGAIARCGALVDRAGPEREPAVHTLWARGDLRSGARPHGGVRWI